MQWENDKHNPEQANLVIGDLKVGHIQKYPMGFWGISLLPGMYIGGIFDSKTEATKYIESTIREWFSKIPKDFLIEVLNAHQ